MAFQRRALTTEEMGMTAGGNGKCNVIRGDCLPVRAKPSGTGPASNSFAMVDIAECVVDKNSDIREYNIFDHYIYDNCSNELIAVAKAPELAERFDYYYNSGNGSHYRSAMGSIASVREDFPGEEGAIRLCKLK